MSINSALITIKNVMCIGVDSSKHLIKFVCVSFELGILYSITIMTPATLE